MIYALLDKLPLGWALKFALFRLLARWRSFLTVIIGVFLAAIIGANVPLYTSAVSQVGLIERLRQNPLEDVHIYSRVTYTSGDDGNQIDDVWQSLDEQVQEEVNNTLSSEFPNWVEHSVTGLESSPLQVVIDDEQLENTRLRVAYYTNWETQVNIVEGTLPQTISDDSISIQAAIPFQAAVAMGIEVGDELTLIETARETSQPITVHITAIVIEADFTDAVWFEPSPMRVDIGSPLETNLLTTHDSAIQVAQEYIPDTRSRLQWRIVFDYTQVAFDDTNQAITQLDLFEDNLETILNFPSSSYIYNNAVINIIENYQEEVSRLNAPFGLLLLQIGALVLLFLVVIVALVRRGERREIAMLQSRGSFDGQIVLIRGLEALIICIIATLSAPFIARQLLLLVTPSLMNVERISLDINQQTFILSAFASGSALIVLIMTLRPVLKLPLISAGGSAIRSATQMWWQRYYLDIVLIVLGIAGLWRLIGNNSTLVETSSGETRADPLLMLTPALLFLALGSALLRLFPILMQLITRIFTTRPGLGSALAGWQVSREPIHYARITFLLALSVGIGWFATSFQATVTRSQQDQAYYQVGTDLRISELAFDGSNTQPPSLETYTEMEDVNTATQALRFTDVGVAINTISFGTGDLLAIDYDTFEQTAFWRDDLGNLPSPSLGREIELSGRLLEAEPAQIELWARLNSILESAPNITTADVTNLARITALPQLVWSTTITAVFTNESGGSIPFELHFEEIEGFDTANVAQLNPRINSFEYLQEVASPLSGWVHFSIDMTSIPDTFADNSRFLGFFIQTQIPRGGNRQFELFLTDLAITDTNGNLIGQDWLVDEGWELSLIEQLTPFGALEIQRDPMRTDGSGGQQVIWLQTNENNFIDLSLDPVEEAPIPAIVSQSFAELNNLDVGLTFPLSINQTNLTFEITDVVNYFPTLYEERPFIVTDLATLTNRLNARSSNPVFANETWLDLNDGVSDIEFLQQFQLDNPERGLISADTYTETLNTFSTDPLSLGLIGLLFLSFLVVLVLSIISLLTYAALTAQARRAEFGVLQALGMRSSRITYSIALEQLLVVGISIIIGAIIGAILSSQVLPTLANSTSTQAIAPPFIVQTEIDSLIQYAITILVMLGIVLTVSLMLVRQLSLSQALRLGEE